MVSHIIPYPSSGIPLTAHKTHWLVLRLNHCSKITKYTIQRGLSRNDTL